MFPQQNDRRLVVLAGSGYGQSTQGQAPLVQYSSAARIASVRRITRAVLESFEDPEFVRRFEQ